MVDGVNSPQVRSRSVPEDSLKIKLINLLIVVCCYFILFIYLSRWILLLLSTEKRTNMKRRCQVLNRLHSWLAW